MQPWWEIISVFLLSTVKFIFFGAVPLALGFGFSFFEAVTVTSLGGFTGVVFFVFLSEKLIENVKKLKAKKQQSNTNQAPKKIFTRKNKFIVKVKHRFGLIGIAFLTPLLLSIPLGCYLAVRYFKDKHLILIYMFVSILFWSVSVSSAKLFFPDIFSHF
jgi:uncharacterized membrane protein